MLNSRLYHKGFNSPPLASPFISQMKVSRRSLGEGGPLRVLPRSCCELRLGVPGVGTLRSLPHSQATRLDRNRDANRLIASCDGILAAVGASFPAATPSLSPFPKADG